jgi:ubiquinone/menaquinone biosynthesis C-methylase UbiE
MEKAYQLDSPFRRLIQKPGHILSKYIKQGMKVLDLGCGTGYFTGEIARRLHGSGKVVAVDVQQGMLDILVQKIKHLEYGQCVAINRVDAKHLRLAEKDFDFVLAFYSFHEMQYLDNIMEELGSICKPKAKILMAEQKFHVSRAEFEAFEQKLILNGFKTIERPRIFLSRAVVMERN